MKKTITIQAYDRPDELKQCLNHISNLKGLSEWTVYGFVDGGANSHRECKQIMLNSDIINYSNFHTQNLGLREANKWTFQYIFQEVGSTLNLHIEEDILVGPNCLNFINSCLGYLNNKTKSISLWSHPSVNTGSRKIHRVEKFSCWGWLTSKKFYKDYMRDRLEINKDGFEGWAGSVNNLYHEEGFYEIHPEKRRVKQIGWNSGVHSEAPNEHRLRGEDKAWTGEEFSTNYDIDLCDYCPNCSDISGVIK